MHAGQPARNNGGRSSVVEHRVVAAAVVGSIPIVHPIFAVEPFLQLTKGTALTQADLMAGSGILLWWADVSL